MDRATDAELGPRHATRVVARFERDIFPWLGGQPIARLNAPEVLSMLRRIEARGTAESAHRALTSCSQVFRYAVATGRAEQDPTRDLRGALAPVKVTHFAAITEPQRVGRKRLGKAPWGGWRQLDLPGNDN